MSEACLTNCPSSCLPCCPTNCPSCCCHNQVWFNSGMARGSDLLVLRIVRPLQRIRMTLKGRVLMMSRCLGSVVGERRAPSLRMLLQEIGPGHLLSSQFPIRGFVPSSLSIPHGSKMVSKACPIPCLTYCPTDQPTHPSAIRRGSLQGISVQHWSGEV